MSKNYDSIFNKIANAKIKQLLLVIFFLMSFFSVSGQVTYTINEVGNTEIDCSQAATFVDSGGSSGDYSENEIFTKTYTSSTGGALKFEFTNFNVEPNGDDCYDVLTVYDGNSVSSPKIADYCGSTSFSVTSSGDSITFVFDSDGSVQQAGWIANVTCVPLVDTDNDGIPDITDVDNDNDGISDLDEGLCSSNTEHVNVLSNFSTGAISSGDNGTYPTSFTGVNYDATFIESGNSITVENLSAAGEQGVVFEFDGDTGHTGSIDLVFSQSIYGGEFKLTDFDQREILTVNVYDHNGTLIDLSSTGYVLGMGTNITQVGNVFTEIDSDNNVSGDDVDSDGIGSVLFNFSGIAISRINIAIQHQEGSSIRFTELKSFCAARDSDGDGTPDYLDTDSDNDGCLDADEGLTDSQNAGVTSCSCPFASGVDTDNDGVDDFCDLDDDNDGILDTNEGFCNGILNSGTWSVTGTTATYDYGNGVIARVTTTDADSFVNTATFNNETFWSESIGGNASIENAYDWGTTLTLSFEDADGNPVVVHKPIVHFDRVGGFSGTTSNSALITLQNGLTWTELANATDDFESTSTTVRDSSVGQTGVANFESTQEVNTGTASGSLQVDSAVSSFTVLFVQDGVNGAGGDGIEMILSICSSLDTDNDGTPDYLDTDSDNDGCFDAIEGGDNILATNVQSNGQLDGTVNTTTGVLDNVNTTNGQSVGTSIDDSTFDTFGQCDTDGDGVVDVDDVCDGYDDTIDTDNDTIPNGCDLDDDNDGILDADEGCSANIVPGEVNATPPVGAWEVFVYDGHFAVPNATNPTDRPSHGADGTSGGTPVLSAHGFYSGSATTYTFNDTNILGTQNPIPSVVASGVEMTTLETFTTSNSGNWAVIYKRTIENNGTITIGAAGSYVDDWVELYINGNLVDSINEFTNNLPIGDVISESITAGDEVEIRLSNGLSIGGFNLSITTLNETTTATLCDLDTDGDGVYNHLDTDSDDDGCADAIEGAGNIIDGLSTLTGGSPTANSSSQNLGTDADNEGNPKLNPGDAAGFEQATTLAVTDNSDSTACTIDLSLTKTVNTALPKVGDNIVYTLTVTNNGPLNATGISVTDALPAGLTYVSDTSGGDYTANTWDVGVLNTGASKSISITASVDQAGEIVNTAQVVAPTSQTDIDSTPNNGN